MSTTCCGDRRFNDSATRCADVAGGTEHEASASDSADSASDTDTKSPPTACSSSCTSSCVARTTSSLKDAVRTALSQLLEERKTSHDDISQDVYRAIRDEAQLLLERQKIADCLDSDPFGLMKYESAGDDTVNNKATVERVKNMLSVVSCTRTTTLDGHSSIRAVVQLSNDGKMKGVDGNIRLHFCFLREPQHYSKAAENNAPAAEASDEPEKKRKRPNEGESEEDCDRLAPDSERQFEPNTIVSFQLDYSVDHGKMDQIFQVDVYASGRAPSIEEAIPIIDEEDGEDEEDLEESNGGDGWSGILATLDGDAKAPPPKGTDEYEEVQMEDDASADQASDSADRFGVFIHLENVVAFLKRSGLRLNEHSVFYFLLSFPFYEHEWDISGFLLSMLGDEDDDDEDEQVCKIRE